MFRSIVSFFKYQELENRSIISLLDSNNDSHFVVEKHDANPIYFCLRSIKLTQNDPNNDHCYLTSDNTYGTNFIPESWFRVDRQGRLINRYNKKWFKIQKITLDQREEFSQGIKLDSNVKVSDFKFSLIIELVDKEFTNDEVLVFLGPYTDIKLVKKIQERNILRLYFRTKTIVVDEYLIIRGYTYPVNRVKI